MNVNGEERKAKSNKKLILKENKNVKLKIEV